MMSHNFHLFVLTLINYEFKLHIHWEIETGETRCGGMLSCDEIYAERRNPSVGVWLYKTQMQHEHFHQSSFPVPQKKFRF